MSAVLESVTPSLRRPATGRVRGRLDEGSVLAGRYLLGRRLGAGGLAEVFAARQLRLGREVAVKVPRERANADEHVAREGRVLAAFAHPGVVAVHEAGVSDGRPFVAMQRLRGRTLGQVAPGRRWAPAAVAELVAGLARALVHVHGRGFAHGDLKPNNIIVADPQNPGGVRLIDFGEAQALGAQESTPRLWGAPRYLAPERCLGDPASVGSDLYAVGVIAWELLSGQPLFPGLRGRELMRAQLVAEAPPIVPVGPVGAALGGVVAGMLSKDPWGRPADAAALEAAVGGILRAAARLPREAPEEAPRSLRRPRPRPGVVAVERGRQL